MKSCGTQSACIHSPAHICRRCRICQQGFTDGVNPSTMRRRAALHPRCLFSGQRGHIVAVITPASNADACMTSFDRGFRIFPISTRHWEVTGDNPLQMIKRRGWPIKPRQTQICLNRSVAHALLHNLQAGLHGAIGKWPNARSPVKLPRCSSFLRPFVNWFVKG